LYTEIQYLLWKKLTFRDVNFQNKYVYRFGFELGRNGNSLLLGYSNEYLPIFGVYTITLYNTNIDSVYGSLINLNNISFGYSMELLENITLKFGMNFKFAEVTYRYTTNTYKYNIYNLNFLLTSIVNL